MTKFPIQIQDKATGNHETNITLSVEICGTDPVPTARNDFCITFNMADASVQCNWLYDHIQLNYKYSALRICLK